MADEVKTEEVIEEVKPEEVVEEVKAEEVVVEEPHEDENIVAMRKELEEMRKLLSEKFSETTTRTQSADPVEEYLNNPNSLTSRILKSQGL